MTTHWKTDMAGIYHWHGHVTGHVENAASEALATLPNGPAWFWFNGTPAPLMYGDGPARLIARWMEWREAYQAGALLDKLTEFSKVRL